MEFASFPKNLAYNIKTLSGFSKTTVKLTPDRTSGSVRHGETFKVRLPSNSIIDLRTFTMFAEGTCAVTSGENVHFPRLTSSLIKTLAVYVNGTLIERIDNYNILYNKLYDLDGGGVDQTAKRFLEISDPCVLYSTGANSLDHTAGTPKYLVNHTEPSDTKRKLMINNWLGFISTCNCPCPDTNDLNLIEIEITLADEKVLWCSRDSGGADHGAVAPVNAGFALENIHFTISKIVFNDPLYYNLKASKLLSSGLTIGYQTYITSKSAAVTKQSSVNVLTTVNSTSLDQLICCLQPADPQIYPLQLSGSNSAATVSTFEGKAVAILVGQTNPSPFHSSAGDLYNQSFYFKSDATGLVASSIEINNTPLMPQPFDDAEIYNETLIALGNLNQDMSSGIHPGCRSLSLFLKYYFTQIVSLENIQQGDFYKSGLDGKSSALNVAWKMTFNGASTDYVTPYIFAKTTRVMVVNEGHAITVVV
jgi:hypothetical protein